MKWTRNLATRLTKFIPKKKKSPTLHDQCVGQCKSELTTHPIRIWGRSWENDCYCCLFLSNKKKEGGG